jgi:DNA-directed RNA polymerase subunit RPC12/RpoP
VASPSLKERKVMNIKEFKCPNCGGTVKFDSTTQNIKCPHCGAEFETKALYEYQKELESKGGDHFNWKADSEEKWEENTLGDLCFGSCPFCGAELIGDKKTIGMICPCCGNAQIEQKQAGGMLKPEYCIPFKLEKKSAVEVLKQFCDGKRLLPDFFKKENCIENIQGMYVPFWLFDAKTRAHIRYKAAKETSYSDDDYDYTKTDYYFVVREGNLNFKKVLVDGSEKMNDIYMDAIQPFDYAQVKKYQSEYLTGYSAGKYDVDVEAGREKANTQIKNSIEREFANSVTGYSRVEMESSAVNIDSGKIGYALLPVWILNTKYKDKNYQIIMNAQTGKFAGKLPVDKGKAVKYRLMFTAVFGMIFTVAIQLLRMFL